MKLLSCSQGFHKAELCVKENCHLLGGGYQVKQEVTVMQQKRFYLRCPQSSLVVLNVKSYFLRR